LQRIRSAQQHPIARLQTHVLDQHVRALVHAREQFLVGCSRRLAVQIGPDRRALSVPRRDRAIEQFGRAIDAGCIRDIRILEQHDGPMFGARQVIASKGIDVSGRFHPDLLERGEVSGIDGSGRQ